MAKDNEEKLNLILEGISILIDNSQSIHARTKEVWRDDSLKVLEKNTSNKKL
ncbi:MAG: hypothetical protein NUV97_04050 [archaeon]|nr:hypothetical protein [archaeon]